MATRKEKTFWKRVHQIVNAPLMGEHMKINVNGADLFWPDSKPLYYEDILKLAGEREGASVVCKPADKRLAGFTLCRGQSCPPTEGMKINCIMTGNA